MMLNSPVKTLIIDDDRVRKGLFEETLGVDQDIHFTSKADKGVELAASLEPDVILLSVNVADSDGFVLCHRLKGDIRTMAIPILLIADEASEAMQERGFELGALDFILLPISPPLLRARVNAYARLSRQIQQVASLAACDPLTGLANRKKFEDLLALELERCNRSHIQLSLLLIDIDEFTAYNEKYGHGMGELCLESTGRILSGEAARTNDQVCRIGSDEFAVILPGTDVEGAHKLAHSILDEFAIRKIIHERQGDARYLTVSIGVATIDYKLHPPGTVSVELLQATAQRQLQQAQAKGGNGIASQYVVAEE